MENYYVQVLDEHGTTVASFSDLPAPGFDGVTQGTWSSRRHLSFPIKNDGKYTVAFFPSIGGEPGSFLVGGVQLESIQTDGSEPGPYFPTQSNRLYTAAQCGASRTPAELQAAFSRKCVENQGCYYELTNPVSIDTSSLADGVSNFQGKLAAGNNNYRHIDVALNVVGTGVTNCENQNNSSCYGSGYVEYSLEHGAFDIGILNFNKEKQYFSFGSSSINHGKALAAERFITNPIGSADQALLNQPSVQKHEFRGRPLDGSYQIRIWDSPALQWDRLEDIQFVFTYRYWSPIVKQGSSN